MKKHPMLKYLKETGPQGDRLPLIQCPGCGSGQVLNAILQAVDRVIEEDGIRKENFVFISGVGCSPRLTSHYLNFDSGWTIHGRTLAIATGHFRRVARISPASTECLASVVRSRAEW